MNLISYKRGQTGIILRVKIKDSSVSTGAGLTGLVFDSSGLIISTIADNEAAATTYTVTGSTIETIATLGTYAAPTATKCRFKEVDATNHKGVYEIQLANARYAVSGAKSLIVSITGAANAADCDVVIPLTDVDPYTSFWSETPAKKRSTRTEFWDSASTFARHLARNPIQIVTGCYVTPTANTPNFGGIANVTRSFINLTHNSRIRQNGLVTGFKLYIGSTTNLVSLRFTVWRARPEYYGTYCLIHRTEAIVPGATGVNTFGCAPFEAQEGDYIGVDLLSAGTACAPFYAASGAVTDMYWTDGAIDDTNWTPSNHAGSPNYVIPIQTIGQAPHLVTIGDSLPAGHLTHYTFAEDDNTTDLGVDPGAIIAKALGCASQNLSIGSQYTSDIATRFVADVINFYPRIAILQGGVNDLSNAISKSTFLANWTTILDYCKSYGIVPVVCLIAPWTAGTNQNMIDRDDWNASLAALAATYSGAIVVNFDRYLGQNRTGGSPTPTTGNLWDIGTYFRNGTDGVHFNRLGYGHYAQAILDAMSAAGLTHPQNLAVKSAIATLGDRNVTWYVNATGGDDTKNDGLTEQAGFATLSHALSVASSGDTIQLSAGTHTQSGQAASLSIAEGITVRGKGKGTTIISSAFGGTVLNWASNPILKLYTGTAIENLSVVGSAANGTTYQVPISTDTGCFYADVRGCYLSADYCGATIKTSGTLVLLRLEDCIVDTKVYSVLGMGNIGSEIVLHRCTLNVGGTTTFTSRTTLVGVYVSGGICIRLQDCLIHAKGTAADGQTTINRGVYVTGQWATVNLWNTRIQAEVVGSGSAVDLVTDTSGIVYVSSCRYATGSGNIKSLDPSYRDPQNPVIHYVRTPADSGSDSNDGLSWDTAKATIAAAIIDIGSATGHAVYVGPGTFALGSASLTLRARTLIRGAGINRTKLTSSIGSLETGPLFFFNDGCTFDELSIVSTPGHGYHDIVFQGATTGIKLITKRISVDCATDVFILGASNRLDAYDCQFQAQLSICDMGGSTNAIANFYNCVAVNRYWDESSDYGNTEGAFAVYGDGSEINLYGGSYRAYNSCSAPYSNVELLQGYNHLAETSGFIRAFGVVFVAEADNNDSPYVAYNHDATYNFITLNDCTFNREQISANVTDMRGLDASYDRAKTALKSTEYTAPPADYQQREVEVTLPESPPEGYGGTLNTADLLTALGMQSGNMDAQLEAVQKANEVVTLPESPPEGYGGTLDANSVRTAIGLASANLDTQLAGTLKADLQTIKTQPVSCAVPVRIKAIVGKPKPVPQTAQKQKKAQGQQGKRVLHASQPPTNATKRLHRRRRPA